MFNTSNIFIFPVLLNFEKFFPTINSLCPLHFPEGGKSLHNRSKYVGGIPFSEAKTT